MNENKMNKNFEDIRKELDRLDETREEIIPLSRKIIRNCSEIIKSIHRNQFDPLEKKLSETWNLLTKVDTLSHGEIQEIGKRYDITARQEYVEAAVLYSYAVKNKIPSFSELNVKPYEYILGLADVVGELKRMVLNALRNNDVEKAEKIFDSMEIIYQYLFSLDYPDGLIPGFRKKVDIARNIVRGTLQIIVTSKNSSTLNKNIEKLLSKIKEDGENSQN